MLPLRIVPVWAADIVIKVGVDLPLTGANTTGAQRIRNAVKMAFDDANQNHEIPGYRIEMVVYDDATPAVGQSDPAQAATNARRMVSDTMLAAAIGPVMSGAAKAMSAILSEGHLAIVTGGATNPDITDPKFAALYHPFGKPIFFRTCTTDAYQGPNLANFFANTLKVKTVYVLDDSGAYGIGIADSFQEQAKKKGITVLGRDRLDPKAADYAAALTKIKQLGPNALYFGGTALAGTKLAKQAYDIIPNVIKGAGDGMYSADLLTGAGFPAVGGWYVTIASPHITEGSRAASFFQGYRDKFGASASDGAVAFYDAALVVIDSVKRVAASGQPVTRDAVRDAIQSASLDTVQGLISFDQNGDINDRTISIFQISHDETQPIDDVRAQYRYVGAAPQS
jgi:branched-chain amino acid transport system substrate-binding protein